MNDFFCDKKNFQLVFSSISVKEDTLLTISLVKRVTGLVANLSSWSVVVV
jgi:hypothetical protein